MARYARQGCTGVHLLLLLSCLWLGMSAQAEEVSSSAAPQPVSAASFPRYSNEALLTQMLLVDAAERTLDASPALALTFSQDLAPQSDYNAFITLTAGGKKVEGSWVLASEPRRLYFTSIQPQTEYRIQIRPGLVSKDGLQLQKPTDNTVKIRAVEPAFDFASNGSLLPAKLTGGLPVRVMNIAELDVEFLRVLPDKLPEMLKMLSLGGRLSHWQLDEIHAVTESVYARRYATHAKPNARTSLLLPVENIAELQTPGLYFAVVRQPGRFNDDAYRINPFVVTNIGLHVRLYPHGLEVFASALDSGKPMAGVQLGLQGDKESLQLETDDNGRASFGQRPAGNLLLTAQDNQQFAFLDLRAAPLDLFAYPATGLPDRPIAPFIYASRDLFRPGDKLHLSILLRDRDGRAISGDSLHLRIVRPDSKLLLEETLQASHAGLGFFDWGWQLPSDAPAGRWTAEVRINAGDEIPANTFSFQVEDFRPERMQLSLLAEDKFLSSNEKLMIAVQGDYLHGTAASGNRLTATRTLSLNQHPLEAFKDYFFGDPLDATQLEPLDLPELTLNEMGGGFLEIPPLAGKPSSPLTVGVVGSLHETGGRSVTRKLEVPFWPAPALVGIRPLFSKHRTAANAEAGFELVRLNAEGKAVPLTQPLIATLVREDKEPFWEYSATEGWLRKDIASDYLATQQKLVLDAQGKGRVALAVQAGDYRVEVEDPETGLKAVYPFHAGWDGGQAGNDATHPEPIGLALDKQAYLDGEVVKLDIAPSGAGEALVTLEGESMLWAKRISLPAEGTTVEIPLDKKWVHHDLYATVTAFRPANGQQQLIPSRALGIIHIPLEREQRRLSLKMEVAEKVLPEQPLAVTVSADNLGEEEAVVTLAAVDAAALSATGFKTPDPFGFYFSPHQYEVSLYDDYGKIIAAEEGASQPPRLAGDVGQQPTGSLFQTDARIVALFSGVVKFDANGKAKLDFALPNFHGTLRLMAVAASGERFGSIEREVVVVSPVVASLSAPGFLAGGDSSFLSVDLHNTTSTEQPVKLSIRGNALLKAMATERELSVAAGKHETLRLPLVASQAFGTAQVELELAGKGFTVHHQLPLTVRPAYPRRHVSLAHDLQPGETLELDAEQLQGFLPAGLDASLGLAAATPPLPLRSALQSLLQSPQGSLEQTTSSAWPYLFLDEAVSARLGLAPVDRQVRQERVNAALLHLTGMQLANGGFTLWGAIGKEEYWLTPHVVDFLLDAKEQGFIVPEWLLQRALHNLEERLQENAGNAGERFAFSETPDHLELATRAYAAYVLSRVKRAPLPTLRAMYDEDAGKAASPLPLVHLGLALYKAGDPDRAKAAWQKAATVRRDEQKYFGDHGSALREQAAMLYLLLRYKVDLPQQAEAVSNLTELMHNRDHFSAQEQLFLFLAGIKYEDKRQSAWQAVLQTGTDSVNLSGKASHFQSLGADAFHKGVRLTAMGKQPLHVVLSVDGYPESVPAPDSDPVEVQRNWYSMDGKLVQPKDIKPGQLLLTHLMLSSAVNLRDALVTDWLPAGFAMEYASLPNNEALQVLQLEGMDKPVAELLGSSSLRTEALLADRYVAALPLSAKARHHLFYVVRAVSAGEFAIPPAQVEDMYRPELNGTGAVSGSLSIP